MYNEITLYRFSTCIAPSSALRLASFLEIIPKFLLISFPDFDRLTGIRIRDSRRFQILSSKYLQVHTRSSKVVIILYFHFHIYYILKILDDYIFTSITN